MLDNKGKRLAGLKFVLSVGSSFLNARAILIHFLSLLNQNSKFFNISTRIFLAVALFEGTFFTAFFTYAQKLTESRIFCLF